MIKEIESEKLAYWYFRINGFFSIPNFVIHSDEGSDQRTEIDLFGIRFPHRKELLNNSMEDDKILTDLSHDKTLVVLVEVTLSKIKINETWKEKERKNMQRALNACGILQSDKEVEKASEELYKTGGYENSLTKIVWICIGKEPNDNYSTRYPKLVTILYDDIFEFIFNRFTKYYEQKLSHDQWDDAGKLLFDTFKKGKKKQLKNPTNNFTHTEYENMFEITD